MLKTPATIHTQHIFEDSLFYNVNVLWWLGRCSLKACRQCCRDDTTKDFIMKYGPFTILLGAFYDDTKSLGLAQITNLILGWPFSCTIKISECYHVYSHFLTKMMEKIGSISPFFLKTEISINKFLHGDTKKLPEKNIMNPYVLLE